MTENSLGEITVTIIQKEVNAVENTARPTISFTYTISTRADRQDAHAVIVRHASLELMVVREDNTWLTIGDARSQKIQYRWNPNGTTEIVFILSSDYHTLSQIEKLRRGQRLSLRPTMRFIFHPDNEPNNTQEKEIGIEYWHIPKSHWVEEILPKVNYRNVALIEVADIDYPELAGTIEKMKTAWKKYAMGETGEVLVTCRHILEDLSDYLRKAGFEIKVEGADGIERPVPDWKKFLNHKDKGDILSNINQKMNGFVVPAAHTGSVIDIHEAYFALIQTYSLLYYVIEHLKKNAV